MNLGFRTHIANLHDELLKFQYYNSTENPDYLGKLDCPKPQDKALIKQKFFECAMLEDEFRQIGATMN